MLSTSARAFRALGLALAGALLMTACDNATKTAAPAPEKASAAPAGLTSNVAVKGDEPLPPKHPPLPNASLPVHPPGGPAGNNKAALDQHLAAQHPQPASDKKKPRVSVPDSVKGKWAAVNIAVTGPDGKERTARVALGGSFALDGQTQLRIPHYLPAYTSDFATVTSASNEPKNPAIQVETIVDGKPVEQGWVFQNLPDFNSYRSEKIKVRLISAEAVK